MTMRGVTLLLLLATQTVLANPDGNYRLFERMQNVSVTGPSDDYSLGNFNDIAFDSQGRLFAIGLRNSLAVYDAATDTWSLIDGRAKAIGGDRSRGLVAYTIDPTRVRERTEVEPARLPAITGYAEQLAIGPDDRLWVTTHDYTIYRQDGDSWEQIPGLAKDIEVGAEGSVYAMHADESPAPRRDRNKMREPPETLRIKKWSGAGWDLLPEVDTYKIRSLAVDPTGAPWIAYDQWDNVNGGYTGSVVARFVGGRWETVSPQGMYIPRALAVDENGQMWLDVERDWPGDIRTRAFMTWQGDGWRQEFNIQMGEHSHTMDVYAGLPRLGLFAISNGRPRVKEGWVVYPRMMISDINLSPSGDIWVTSSFREQSFRWLGGNDFADARPGTPLTFYPDGEWVGAYVNLPTTQRRGRFEHIARIDGDSFLGVTMAPLERAVNPAPRMQTVYLVEGGRSIALGDAFRTVQAVAADDKGRAWVYAQPRLPGRPPPPALYRWENGAWTSVDMPTGFEHYGDLRTGLDNAVLVTGHRTDQGNRTAVALWRNDKWSYVPIPPRTSMGRAVTDKDGVVWGTNNGSITYQEGAAVTFEVPEPLQAEVEAVANEKPAATFRAETTATGESASLPMRDNSISEAIAAIESAAEARTGSLIGCWTWSNGASITVLDNGQAHNGVSPAPWTAMGGENYEIQWPDFVATVTLGTEGATMSEESLFGSLTGQRVGGSGQTFEGVWQLDNGATAVAAADGSYQIGAFTGTWQAASGARRFEVRWPVRDKIRVSPDGQSLTGSNQFGQFTARKANCN